MTELLTPAERFSKFEGYEIHPCTLHYEDNGIDRYYDQCEPDDPNLFCWSLYGVVRHAVVDGIHEGGLDCIADFATEAEAEYFKAILEILPSAVNALNLMDIMTNKPAIRRACEGEGRKVYETVKKDAKAALIKGAPWII